MSKVGIKGSDEYRRFEILQVERHQEQSHYWIRFTGFATLHAGLFVFATSTKLEKWPYVSVGIALLGIVLAATWVEVQRLSLQYVDRWKPLYHDERRRLKFDFSGIQRQDPRFSSTDLANVVPPVIVAIVWCVLLVLTVLDASRISN